MIEARLNSLRKVHVLQNRRLAFKTSIRCLYYTVYKSESAV